MDKYDRLTPCFRPLCTETQLWNFVIVRRSVRSESVPRTIRTMTITARVESPTPVSRTTDQEKSNTAKFDDTSETLTREDMKNNPESIILQKRKDTDFGISKKIIPLPRNIKSPTPASNAIKNTFLDNQTLEDPSPSLNQAPTPFNQILNSHS